MQGDALNAMPSLGTGNSDCSGTPQCIQTFTPLRPRAAEDTFSRSAQPSFGQARQPLWIKHLPPSLRQYLPQRQEFKTTPKRNNTSWLLAFVGALGAVGSIVFLVKKGHLGSSTKNSSIRVKPPASAPPTVNTPPNSTPQPSPPVAAPAAPGKAKVMTVPSITTVKGWLENKNVPTNLDEYDFSQLGSHLNAQHDFGFRQLMGHNAATKEPMLSTTCSLIERAVTLRQPELVKKLLDAGADIRQTSPYSEYQKRNLLHEAVGNVTFAQNPNFVATVGEVLKKHPELMLEKDGQFERSPLHMAITGTFMAHYDPSGQVHQSVIRTMYDTLKQTPNGRKIWQDAVTQKDRDGLTAAQIASNRETRMGNTFPQDIMDFLKAQPNITP